MPAIRHASKRKAPPAGFSDIEDDLLIFSNRLKDATNASSTSAGHAANVPRHASHWKIFQISHQRSRYVYELYYKKEAISKELYDWLLKNGYADAGLIAKWKKDGYQKVSSHLSFLFLTAAFTPASPRVALPWNSILTDPLQLCCLRCIQTKETNFNSTCICRVPKAQLKEGQEIECVSCGCRGCASED
jgi:bud site selection protein 31